MIHEYRVTLRDGLRLRVEERGGGNTGPPLLLLHGFTGSVEAWGEQLLGCLALRRRVLAVDLPGHGGSDVPREPERYAIEGVVDDLCELLDRADASSAVWVGYSMGGRVALAAGVLRPGRVEALVLESASPGLAEAAERRSRRMSDEALARRIEIGGMESFVDDWMELPLFASQQRLSEEVLEAERSRRMACDPRGLAGALRGLGTGRQPSFWGRLGEIRAPALLVNGRLDGKFDGIAARMAAAMPAAARHPVDGAGHAVHLERPAEWLKAVEGFLCEVVDEEGVRDDVAT